MMIKEKVPGGKLVCLDLELSSNQISRIRITGDFFLHPENTIVLIEESLIGASVDQVARIVDNVLLQNNAQVIGFEPEDIERLVKKADKGGSG